MGENAESRIQALDPNCWEESHNCNSGTCTTQARGGQQSPTTFIQNLVYFQYITIGPQGRLQSAYSSPNTRCKEIRRRWNELHQGIIWAEKGERYEDRDVYKTFDFSIYWITRIMAEYSFSSSLDSIFIKRKDIWWSFFGYSPQVFHC